MPVVARFYGVVLRMYLRQKEHNPPHIHAVYGDYVGCFSMKDGEMFEGDMPQKVQQMIKEFILHYEERLMVMWETQEFELLPPLN